MEKLPVLYVSCNAERLAGANGACSGPARMVWGRNCRGVVLVRVVRREAVAQGDPLELIGSGVSAARIAELLGEKGFPVRKEIRDHPDLGVRLRSLLGRPVADQAQLTLSIGLSERSYSEIGQCLEHLREEGILIVCLDNRTDRTSPESLTLRDQHLREVINGWVQDQQWQSVLSFLSRSEEPAVVRPLEDPTLCLLRAAFSMGGSRFPQRVFSSGMNSGCQAMSGFGWMR